MESIELEICFLPRAQQGVAQRDYWIFDASIRSSTRRASYGGSARIATRAGGAGFPERVIWLKDSLAVFAHSTPGQSGTLAYEDIEINGVGSQVEAASVPPHWFLLQSNSTPRDLTPGMRQVSPVPVYSNGSQFLVEGDGRIWQLDVRSPLRLFLSSRNDSALVPI
jgi:hypothetical protein